MPQQASPTPSARSSKNHEVYQLNAKLFRSVRKTFKDPSPANYEKLKSSAIKLSNYLKDQRGYYDEAKPEIVDLITTVQQSLMKSQGVVLPTQLPSHVFQTHPIGICLVQIMTAIQPHVHRFVEPQLQAIVRDSLALVGLAVPQLSSPPAISAAGTTTESPRVPESVAPMMRPASILPPGQPFSGPMPLSAGSWSVPYHLASQPGNLQIPAPPNPISQPTAVDPRQLEASRVPMPAYPQQSVHPRIPTGGGDAVSPSSSAVPSASPHILAAPHPIATPATHIPTSAHQQQPRPGGGGTVPTSASAGPSVFPSAPSDPRLSVAPAVQLLPAPLSTPPVVACVPASAAPSVSPTVPINFQSPATQSIPSVIPAKRSEAPMAPTSASAPRPRKKKRTLNIATLQQKDIESLKQRQGSFDTPPGSARVKVEEVEAPMGSLHREGATSTSAVASPVIPRAASIPHPNTVPQRYTSSPATQVASLAMQRHLPELPSQPKSSTPAMWIPPLPQNTANNIQVAHHKVTNVPQPGGPPAPDAALKMQVADIPQPQPPLSMDITMELVATPAAIASQPPTQAAPPVNVELLSAAGTSVPVPNEQEPAATTTEPSKGVNAPSANVQEEASMAIDSPIAPAAALHLVPMEISQSADTATAMDLESLPDESPSIRQPTPTPQAAHQLTTTIPMVQELKAPPTDTAPVGQSEQQGEAGQGSQQNYSSSKKGRDAIDIDQHVASVAQPAPPQPPSPLSEDLFGEDLRTILVKPGLFDNSKLLLEFDLPSEDARLTRRWWDQTGILSELSRDTHCLSLSCYPAGQLDLTQEIGPQLRRLRPQWPQGGGLRIKCSPAAQSIPLPLAPPFVVTPENTFDVSSLSKAGPNAFEITQSSKGGDFSQNVFVLFMHRPTRKQMDKVKKKRKADDDWERWKVEMAKPLPLKIRIPPCVVSKS